MGRCQCLVTPGPRTQAGQSGRPTATHKGHCELSVHVVSCFRHQLLGCARDARKYRDNDILIFCRGETICPPLIAFECGQQPTILPPFECVWNAQTAKRAYRHLANGMNQKTDRRIVRRTDGRINHIIVLCFMPPTVLRWHNNASSTMRLGANLYVRNQWRHFEPRCIRNWLGLGGAVTYWYGITSHDDSRNWEVNQSRVSSSSSYYTGYVALSCGAVRNATHPIIDAFSVNKQRTFILLAYTCSTATNQRSASSSGQLSLLSSVEQEISNSLSEVDT